MLGIVTLSLVGVELLLGDDVVGCQRNHALVCSGVVDGVGFCCGEVGLGLADVFGARAVEGFLEESGVFVEGGVGFSDFLRAVAVLEAVVVGAVLEDGGFGLVALGLILVGLEGDERGIGGDLLAFFHEDAGDSAADLGADVDLAGFDCAGVGEGGGAMSEPVGQRGEEDEGQYGRDEDALALHGLLPNTA